MQAPGPARHNRVVAVTMNPYLSFRGEAADALSFYRSVFGGELSITRFADVPGVPTDTGDANNVMHGQLDGDHGIVLMCADVPADMEHTPFNGSLSLSGDDAATLRGYWEKLVAEGTITEPLVEAPWGDTFGMCVDRFGIAWMVNIAGGSE